MTTRPSRRRPPPSVAPPERNQEELALQVRSLLAEAQALSARLAALNEVAATMQATFDLDTVLQTLATHARWLIDFDSCSVAFREGAHYRLVTLHHDAPPDAAEHYPVERGAIGRALHEGHELLIQQLRDDPTLPPGTESVVIVPLRHGREAVGTLNFCSRLPQHYSQDDLRVAAALALQLSVIVQNTRLFTDVTRARDELHTVLESISDSVLVIDGAGRILLLNRSLRELLRLPTTDLTGVRALYLLRLAAVARPLVPFATLRQLLAEWAANPQRAASGALALADGRHIEWACASLSGGAAEGAVITLRDVSARIELEQLRMDLTHTLVHDLRTPLTALIMGIEILNYIKGDQTETINRLRNSATQMIEHVNTILDVSKLEAGQLELDLTPLQIGSLVRAEIDALVAVAQHNGQQITTTIAPNLPWVMVDAPLMRRVVTNLMGNALKFTPSGGQVQVGAQLAADGAALEVWVEDSGPGISEDLRGRLFEKYAQGAGEQRRKGTGLGLFFCKLAVDAHGGSIGVRSVPSGGSCFWFTLPLGHTI